MLKIHMNQNINLQLKKGKVKTQDFNDFKAFVEYSNDMDDIYKNIEEYNPNKKRNYSNSS